MPVVSLWSCRAVFLTAVFSPARLPNPGPCPGSDPCPTSASVISAWCRRASHYSASRLSCVVPHVVGLVGVLYVWHRRPPLAVAPPSISCASFCFLVRHRLYHGLYSCAGLCCALTVRSREHRPGLETNCTYQFSRFK